MATTLINSTYSSGGWGTGNSLVLGCHLSDHPP
jgi:hypothetical protein